MKSIAIESGIRRLGTGKWLAFYTLETPKAGYDIPPTEDYYRTFETEIEAYNWLSEHLGEGFKS